MRRFQGGHFHQPMKEMTLPTMHNLNTSESNIVVWRKCTPFCDKTVECPEHHELLQAIVNCTDQLGHLSNLDGLKACIEKYQSMGWDRNDTIPDPVASNRLPLIHWAASLGKCNALEWMLSNGFDSTVTIGSLTENALHRTILYLYKSRPKFTTKELKPKFRKICNLLSNLMYHSDLGNGTPLHLAASLLCSSETRLVFFQTAIEVMAAQAKEMNDSDRMATLDAKNNEGNTCLHILAGANEKIKVDHVCTAISALLQSGADKTMRNAKDQTPLDIAIQKGYNNVIDELVKIVNPSTSLVKESPSSSTSHHDSRSLMTMVDMRRGSPVSNSMINLNRSAYGYTERRRSRSRSPVRSPRSERERESPPMAHSKYEDSARNGFLIKQEDENEVDSSLQPTSPASDAMSSMSNIDVNSPLLSHLAEAGLLSEVSDLLSRAKARDESQLKRYQQQAKDLDTQIMYKQKEIERIKSEVETLRKKRNRCDDETAKLKKKLASCSNAIRELPYGQNSNTGEAQSVAHSPAT